MKESNQSKTEQPEPKTLEIKEPSEHSTIETQNALLPCPFCGNEKLNRSASSYLAGTYQVKCGTICCPGNCGWSQESSWNTRAVFSVEPGNEAGAALLSKESSAAPTVDTEETVGIKCATELNRRFGFPLKNDEQFDSIAAIINHAHNASLASLQRKLEEAERKYEILKKDHEDLYDNAEFTETSQAKVIEQMRKALEVVARETVSLPCDDPQCGEDSTWDHECTAGRRAPSKLAEIAKAALSSPVPTEAGVTTE